MHLWFLKLKLMIMWASQEKTPSERYSRCPGQPKAASGHLDLRHYLVSFPDFHGSIRYQAEEWEMPLASLHKSRVWHHVPAVASRQHVMAVQQEGGVCSYETE